jgi:hypothetical protein
MGPVWKTLAALALLAVAVNAQRCNLTTTASNSLNFIYDDGAPVVLGDNAGNWIETDKYEVNAHTRVIGIRANNVIEGCSGILAEIQDHPQGMQFQTNAVNWKCSPAAPNNWQNLGFDDSNWDQAHAVVANGQIQPPCSWIPINSISTNAFWIWTPQYYEDKDMVVSCRGYTPVCAQYSPCQNGGSCLPNSLEFCACPVRYSGRYCENQVHECNDFSPCYNGGSCDLSDTPPGYTCSCGPYYSGANCETDLTQCASRPCQNGGTCSYEGFDDYSCSCPPGFSGVNCEENIDECASEPCLHEATCVDQINGYVCQCIPGYTGPVCATDINECESNPCFNAGTCHDGINEYECECHPGWTGANCDTALGQCTSSPCRNGGTCTLDENNNFVCLCTDGWFGQHCESNEDNCLSLPCHNGGTCQDMDNDYNCSCHPSYEGKQCNYVKPNCGSIMETSQFQVTRNFWSMCQIDIINHRDYLDTPCRDLITGINVFNNASYILDIGGDFGCFVTKYPDEMPAGACVEGYNQAVRLGGCLACTHMGICIKVPGHPMP